MKRATFIILIGAALAASGCAAARPAATAQRAEVRADLPSALERVHFPTARASVLRSDRTALEENARWALAHPDAVLVLEGHCDERGSDGFNLELGDRRARAVLEAFAARGVDPGKLIVISRGERAPLDPRHRPDAWARNRRVEVLVR